MSPATLKRRWALARAWLQLAFVAYQATQMTHAIAITIARVAVTHRKMLEWQTAATVASQHGPAALTGTRLFVKQMLGSPLFAAVALVVVAVRQPRALPAALPILLLWIVAPLLAHWLSQPVVPRRQEIRAADRQFLRLAALRTWRYFDTFAVASDHGLPPDNVQEAPELIVARPEPYEPMVTGLEAVPESAALSTIVPKVSLRATSST